MQRLVVTVVIGTWRFWTKDSMADSSPNNTTATILIGKQFGVLHLHIEILYNCTEIIMFWESNFDALMQHLTGDECRNDIYFSSILDTNEAFVCMQFTIYTLFHLCSNMGTIGMLSFGINFNIQKVRNDSDMFAPHVKTSLLCLYPTSC